MNNAEYIRLMQKQRMKQKAIEESMKQPEIDGIGVIDPEPETPPADGGSIVEAETDDHKEDE